MKAPRGLLKVYGRTGTGVFWNLDGGVPRKLGLSGGARRRRGASGRGLLSCRLVKPD